MTDRKLGWTTHKKALEESQKRTHTSNYLKLIDGSFAALVRIRFNGDYTESSREYLLRDGCVWQGDTLLSRGMVDSAPGWQSQAATKAYPRVQS